MEKYAKILKVICLDCNKYYIPHDNKILIGMLGGPSSGKDTVCDYLSAILSNSNKKITEVARDYMEKNDTLYSPFQERIIFDKIAEREKEVYSTY
jgi:dephospho-CoA kinase